MKKYLFLFQMSVFFSFAVSGQKIDTIACRMFESKLHVVKNSFRTDSSLQVADAVMVLSLLTGITSESDGNYAGQTSPTLKDYRKWYNWYMLNKTNIYWDDKLKVISIRRKS